MSPDASKELPILVVEDNEETQLLLRHLLGGKFAVDTAHDAPTALQHIREQQYRLVLMDINLGSAQDGITIHRKIRATGSYDDVPIIAITAYALPGDRERFIQAGFDGYLSKPFTRKKLLAIIDEVLSAGES